MGGGLTAKIMACFTENNIMLAFCTSFSGVGVTAWSVSRSEGDGGVLTLAEEGEAVRRAAFGDFRLFQVVLFHA